MSPKLQSVWRNAAELLAAGKQADALPLLQRLVKAAPSDPALQYNLGACLFEVERFDDSLRHLRRARQLGMPQDALGPVLARLAARYQAVNRFEPAAEILRDLVAGRPDDAMLLGALADALRELGRFEEALAALERPGIVGQPAALIENAKGLVLQNLGRLEDARSCFQCALELDPAQISTHKNMRYLALNMPGLSAAEVFAIYTDLARRAREAAVFSATTEPPNSVSRPKLRVGYISSDFRMHVVGLNILPLIENHGLDAFELYFYSDVAQEDQISERFKARAARWTSIAGKPDEAAADVIRRDALDIAVFLAGSFDANRLRLAAWRVAPVQVNFHDCATSGYEEMDYFLSDAHLTPPGSPERFTETIVRLPVFYQYERRAAAEVSLEPPCREAGHVTFGSFNKPEKINNAVIALWARVLCAVDGSKLLLKYFDFYRSAEARRRIVAQFVRNGVAEDRLLFRHGYDASGRHLALYESIDVALDTFPFNGATTTFEALSRGVPVIALWGERYVARYSGAILTHAGLPELAAEESDAFVAVAKRVAEDTAYLAELRKTLPGRIVASPLCDGAAYARAVEDAYREMRERGPRT